MGTVPEGIVHIEGESPTSTVTRLRPMGGGWYWCTLHTREGDTYQGAVRIDGADTSDIGE